MEGAPLKGYKPPRYVCEHPDAKSWDYFPHMGSKGVLSKGAVELLTPFAKDYFEFLPLTINGAPYYFLRIKQVLDCLNRERSEFLMDDENGSIIMIERVVFRVDEIPDSSFFCVPEARTGPFGTEDVVDVIQGHKLQGFRFYDTAKKRF